MSEEESSALADAAAAYVYPQGSNAQLRMVITNIRRDLPSVEALRRSGHMGHLAEWESWLGQARAILRQANLDWAYDGAVDSDDLMQVALLQLARSLPGFRYQSRFSTWAYQVITQSVQRHLRDLSAQKRAGEIDGSVDPHTVARAIGEGDHPEAQVAARLLTTTVEAELLAAMGSRNAEVFRLWACDDLSAEMIGQRVGLSVARVYAVIAQARKHLSGQAAIIDWGAATRG
ncbi:sigma-70 family RNA polymerase sigma factor [Oscillochloris sp. ZM17-4]|uniref:sigma-70 family RNA polymerase sigma factor n=1 Tax=Oscillochloris sp. ZM17-4 TaxID=2866714 RepID=UPI001C7341F0|nr:sigma-70 family RNA polymerase sigma factor [Oscillochloris sp. ZM17-4]MBX0329903.1 sigma-70 family RNA polymerase sigma factor [Oscillochloris sp. ZM17-4]